MYMLQVQREGRCWCCWPWRNDPHTHTHTSTSSFLFRERGSWHFKGQFLYSIRKNRHTTVGRIFHYFPKIQDRFAFPVMMVTKHLWGEMLCTSSYESLYGTVVLNLLYNTLPNPHSILVLRESSWKLRGAQCLAQCTYLKPVVFLYINETKPSQMCTYQQDFTHTKPKSLFSCFSLCNVVVCLQ